jgi:hypothetical protein
MLYVVDIASGRVCKNILSEAYNGRLVPCSLCYEAELTLSDATGSQDAPFSSVRSHNYN